MSKAVLISIRPKWCELIASGEKTIEVRKTAPKIETPFKCYIYCTKDPGNKGSATHFFESDEGTFWSAGKAFAAFLSETVIGEFVCDKIDRYARYGWLKEPARYMKSSPGGYPATEIHFADLKLSPSELEDYGKGDPLFGWHISELVIYDKPKKMSEFTGLRKTKFGYAPYEIKRPPQSWCYVEEG